MFGESRADRYQRTVREEVNLLAHEEHEDDLEFAMYFYDDEDYDPKSDFEVEIDRIVHRGWYQYDPIDDDDFDYELGLRSYPLYYY